MGQDYLFKSSKKGLFLQKENMVKLITSISRTSEKQTLLDSGVLKFLGPDLGIQHNIRFKLGDNIIAEDTINPNEQIDLSSFIEEWTSGEALTVEIFCKQQMYDFNNDKYYDHPDDNDVILFSTIIESEKKDDQILTYKDSVGMQKPEQSYMIEKLSGPDASDNSDSADISRQVVEYFERISDVADSPFNCDVQLYINDLPETFELTYFVHLSEKCSTGNTAILISKGLLSYNSVEHPLIATITVKTKLCIPEQTRSIPKHSASSKKASSVTHKIKYSSRQTPSSKSKTSRTGNSALYSEGCGCGKKK